MQVLRSLVLVTLCSAALACGQSEAPPATTPPATTPPADSGGEPAAPPDTEPAAPPDTEDGAATGGSDAGAAGGADDGGGSAGAVTLGDAGAGAEIYAQYCSSCHGVSGAGDGPVAAGLDPKPANHADGKIMNALSNEYLFKVVKEGGNAVGKSMLMAAWGSTLSDDQIRDVIAFVRTLAVPPYEGS